MKVIIPNLYVEYGRYIDRLRAIPYYKDCLKPVERRLLVSLNKTASTRFEKCAKVVGHCIGNYHPHGDMSTYGALVGLANRNFAVGKGNFGLKGLEDANPAAMRYTEIKMSPYIKTVTFELIKYVPWEALELDDEPLYLPGMIPLGLVGEGLTQGIAFNTTKMPRYDYNELLIRLYKLLTNGTLDTIVPQMIDCDVAPATNDSFDDILKTGVGSIWVCPKYKIRNTAIDIYGKNPTNGFSKLKKLCIDYPDMINADDLGGENMCVRAYSLNGPVTPQFISAVVDAITTKINMICNVVMDDGKIETLSIDTLLKSSYDSWKKAWLEQMSDRLEGLKRKHHQLNVIKIIRECYDPKQNNVSDIVKEFKSNITKYPGIDVSDIKDAVAKGRIKELIEASLDFAAIEKTIQKQEQEIVDIDKLSLSKLESIIK